MLYNNVARVTKTPVRMLGRYSRALQNLPRYGLNLPVRSQLGLAATRKRSHSAPQIPINKPDPDDFLIIEALANLEYVNLSGSHNWDEGWRYMQLGRSMGNLKLSKRNLSIAHDSLQEIPPHNPQLQSGGTFHQTWERSKTAITSPANPENVAIISYNVLSQVQLDRHSFVYADVKDQTSKQWNHRAMLLQQQFEEFARQNVDFFCLQEVDDDRVLSFYQPMFKKLGYKMLYQRKCVGGSRDPTPPDGLAVVYKADRFEFQAQEKVKYLYNFQSASVGGLKMSYPNIGLIAKFKLKSNPEKSFVLATTHLTFNPHRGEVKLAQLAILLTRLHLLSQMDNSPVIITGDMNSAVRGDLISQFLAKGNYKYLQKRCSEISGQFAYHSNLKTIPTPPLPRELGIDYRDSTVWDDEKDSEFQRLIEGRDVSPRYVEKSTLNTLAVDLEESAARYGINPLDNRPVSPFDLGVVDYVGHKFDLYSPYLKKKMSNVFSTFFEKEKIQVDHIFVSRSLRVNDYLTLPTVNSEQRGSLLCKDFPSDHYPVGVKFTI